MITLYMMEKMSTRKKYVKPTTEVVDMHTSPVMQFSSGWNVDGEHQGGIEEGGDLEWGEND